MEDGERRLTRVETLLEQHVLECIDKRNESIRKEDKRFKFFLALATILIGEIVVNTIAGHIFG